jgi:pilus assembly protein Flp/PilA
MFNNLATRLVVKAQSALNSRIAQDETGATAVEYGLIVGLIAVAIIGAITILSGSLQGLFTHISDGLDTAATK